MQIRCPHCHVPFESREDPSWTDIICPSCDNSFSLLGATSTRSYRTGAKVLGRFELVDEVGSGRFGSVWKARDTQLQRTVAVKIPRQRDLTEQETELFLRDARAAAQLNHAGIASVHEIGREDDTLYIVTDFIDGANLNEWLSGKRLTPLESAALVCKIAEALHHAHNAGVIHRDVKPGNIMLDRDGQPYVIDFGLARREVGEVTMTADGQVLGTPAYMSPEQARGEGHQADRRSDIYSLGVVLFKLLTGELPFRGELRMLLLQIINDEPPSPRALNASVPRDLETITLKCLEKDPSRRYQTADNLAEDLAHFLTGEPINARPVGRVERAWRWCKRYPEISSLAGALFLLLIAVSIVAPLIALHEAHLRTESELRSKELQNQVAQNFFQRACEEADAGRLAEGIALLAAAHGLVDSHNPLNLSIRNLMAGWASECGRPLVSDSAILAVAFSPDGRKALIAGHDRAASFWDIRTGLPSGQKLQHPNSVRAVAFSPDGRFVLTGCQDKSARLWDLAAKPPTEKRLEHLRDVWAVAFSRDGKIAASGGRDSTARLWDVPSGALLDSPLRHPEGVCAVAFSPDRSRLLTGGGDGTARVWDLRAKPASAKGFRVGNARFIYAVVLSPDGSRVLAASGDRIAEVHDIESLKPLGEPLRHDNVVYAAAWNPDGRTVVTGSFDGTARLWNAKSCEPIGEPLRHGDYVMAVAFSPDGSTVLTGSADRTARLWCMRSKKALLTDTLQAQASADPNAIILAFLCRPFQFCQLQPGLPFAIPVGLVAFDVLAKSPDGRKAVVRSSDDAGQIWDLPTGQKSAQTVQHESKIWTGCFSPDGSKVLTGGQDQRIRIWDSSTGRPAGDPIRHGGIVRTVAFSHNGKLMLSGSTDQTARIWDAQSGAPIGQPLQHPRELVKVAFSPNDRLALTIITDGRAQLWDVGTSQLLARPLQYEIGLNDSRLEIKEGTFGADGDTIQFRCSDGTTRTYDVPRQLPDNQQLIRAFACAYSAFQLDRNGILRQLSQAEWLAARRQLERLQNSDLLQSTD